MACPRRASFTSSSVVGVLLVSTVCGLSAASCGSAHEPGHDDGGARADAGGVRRDAAEPDAAVLDGGSDAGPIGEMCRLAPARYEVVCPDGPVPVGVLFPIRVRAWTGACCSSNRIDSVTNMDWGDNRIRVFVNYTECGCCDECDCVGGVAEATTGIVFPSPGEYTLLAGDSAPCTVIARADPAMCRHVALDEVRVPTAVMTGQDVPATFYARASAGCSCDPRLMPGTTTASLEVCTCCDGCECVDRGYQVSSLAAAPLGERRLMTEIGDFSTWVVSAAECNEVVPSNVSVATSESLRTAGPTITWLETNTEPGHCCVRPRIAHSLVERDGALEMHVFDCTPPELCDCIPPPSGTNAWHGLALAPGRYTLRVGGRSLPIEVAGGTF